MRFTGPGKVEVQPATPATAISASLYNFNVDDKQPKPEHLKWLDENVVPLLLGSTYYVWMRGSASRTGKDQHNLQLSRQRVESVAAHLRSKGVADWQMQTEWIGEAFSRSISNEDEADRAVELTVQPIDPKALEYDPPPPPPQPPRPPVSRFFSIRLLGSVAVGKMVSVAKLARWLRRLKGIPKVGLAVDVMFFEIRDRTNKLSAFYGYGGPGIGVGAYSVSSTHRGPWNEFQTSKPIVVTQFGGATRFTTAGALSWTYNVLHLLGTPKGVDSVYLTISTGLTLGAGLSSTAGDLVLLGVMEASP